MHLFVIHNTCYCSAQWLNPSMFKPQAHRWNLTVSDYIQHQFSNTKPLISTHPLFYLRERADRLFLSFKHSLELCHRVQRVEWILKWNKWKTGKSGSESQSGSALLHAALQWCNSHFHNPGYNRADCQPNGSLDHVRVWIVPRHV